ncbi:hypothetical protein P775_19450 [Puniceibacterium antarcticum]|uniref:Uncharacterized protein n=1 Tax=Puniceibacterium antarcticum TaxID=1206336 RepID=A0A2G8RCC5_9RHOB|nr:hypothetical protein P775_19450 [Puniceibacterium antarcticum]
MKGGAESTPHLSINIPAGGIKFLWDGPVCLWNAWQDVLSAETKKGAAEPRVAKKRRGRAAPREEV